MDENCSNDGSDLNRQDAKHAKEELEILTENHARG